MGVEKEHRTLWEARGLGFPSLGLTVARDGFDRIAHQGNKKENTVNTDTQKMADIKISCFSSDIPPPCNKV